jgi:hypothetical protein
MNRKWLLLGGLALVLVLGVYLVDRGRASSSLRAAYTVREASERCFSSLAAGFERSGISGVVDASLSTEEFAIWARMSQKAAAATQTPIFFGKDRVLAVSIAAKQYDELIRTPRGTWLTLTHEIADKRSRLDAAIIAVETEDVWAGTVTNRRAESQMEIARVAKGIFDAKEKADEAERLAREKEDAPERERRRQIEEQNREWDLAQSPRERTAETNAAVVPATPTPLSIEFSRPKPTPVLGRK